MHNWQCIMRNAQCAMHNAQCTMHNAQCTMHNAQCIIWLVLFYSFDRRTVERGESVKPTMYS